jgi:hypothetical protein
MDTGKPNKQTKEHDDTIRKYLNTVNEWRQALWNDVKKDSIARFFVEVIALLGLLFYVRETKRTNDLTAEALRLQHGAMVRANYQMGWFDLGQKGKIPNVVIITQNDSTKIAEAVEIRAQLEFRKSPPEPTARDFSLGEPQLVTSQKGQGPAGILFPLTPQFDNKGYSRVWVINPDEYRAYKEGRAKLYVWGTIRFRDSLNDTPAPVTFCRYISASDVPVAESDQLEMKGGYHGHYDLCRHP